MSLRHQATPSLVQVAKRLSLRATLLSATVAAFAIATGACTSCNRDDTKQAPPPSGSSMAPAEAASGEPAFEEGTEPPEVGLDGVAHERQLQVAGSSARLGALAWDTAVHKLPDPDSFVLGYLRAGAVVSCGDKPAGFKGCPGGWRAVAPFGYVCLARNNATLDLNHEVIRALSRRPDLSSNLPYMYGIVRKPGPIYARLPTREQAEAAEKGLDQRMREWIGLDGENGASFRANYWLRWKPSQQVHDPLKLWEERTTLDVPWFLEQGRLAPGNLSGFIKTKDDVVVSHMRRHNGFAFIDTTVFEGRRYGITTRLLVMPVDRLRPITGSRMHGYEIPKDIDFPFALVRAKNASAYSYENGRLKATQKLKRWQAIKLTGKQNFFRGVLHFETVDGLWLSDRQVSRLDPAKRMPAWGKNGERWIDINITKQTLVAYDGTKAVFATLVSSGEAGLGDPETSRATKRGIFRIDRKHVTATMDSDVVGEEFELQDIPYVQYFEGGYALHAAYWHSDFGTPRSHGCINLSPDDARRLFFWTEPKLPPGWHTVRRPLTGSVVFVHP